MDKKEEKKKDEKPKGPYIWIPKPVTKVQLDPRTGEMYNERKGKYFKTKNK